ncbi:SUKH-4 family immunity protein [Maribacter forsetii]|uniref:SUKH-4 family immunity protein n=1 Tax=Maribacter forsetii TaxID=444515 RepID=UPI00055FBA61|nr:SUKH-4 family immunity protein [Maribacter forsetii]
MKPEEFKDIWTSEEDILNPINANRLNGLGLSETSIEFLKIAGLPRSAAPFLSFVTDSDDIYKGIKKLTNVYDFLEPKFDKYIVIGDCNDGDPIVINTEKNDQIEHLDHEDYFSSRLFNSDISSMTDCLIAYRNFVERVQKENGENAFMNSNFSDELFEKLKSDLNLADSKIMENNGFWAEQIEMDLEMREDSRNEV